jgi:hypothetical protein
MVIPKDFTTEGSWRHPGGKLLRAGPDTLTDAELLAVLISSGAPQKSAEQIGKKQRGDVHKNIKFRFPRRNLPRPQRKRGGAVRRIPPPPLGFRSLG